MASRSTKTELPFRTSHPSLACYLWFRGFDLEEARWTDGLCRWTFYPSDTIKEAADSFFENEASVDPREYFPKVSEFWREMKKSKPAD